MGCSIALPSRSPNYNDYVGMLLPDAEGAYELSEGMIDTTNLSPGHYVLTLVPDSAITVLKSGLDLDQPVDGNVFTQTTAVSGPDAIALDVEATQRHFCQS